MNAKKWTLLVTMVVVLMATAFANEKDVTKDERRARMEMRRDYFKEHIKPKIDAQRNEFETSISAEDKEEIKRLRDEIISQRLMQNELFFESRAQRIKGEEVKESLLQELEAQRISIENLYDKAKLIANKYRPEIDEIVADLREDIRAEFQDYRNEDGQLDGRRERQWRGPQGKGPGSPGGFHGRSGHGNAWGFAPDRFPRMDLVGFLLWDSNRG